MEQHKNKLISSGSAMIIIVSIIYILIGFSLLLIEQINPGIIIAIGGILIAVVGVVTVLKYFIAADYEETGEYGFSVGIFLIIIGLLILIKFQQLEPSFYMFIGICLLVTSVLKVQNAIDLKGVGSGMWKLSAIVAILFIIASFLIILDPKSFVSDHIQIVFIVLIIDGIVNILSIIMKNIAVVSLKHRVIEHAKDVVKAEKEEKAIPIIDNDDDKHRH